MMTRKHLGSAAVLLLAVAVVPLAFGGATSPESEYYELRIYTFSDAAQVKVVEDYWEHAAIPALNRLGVDRIGVFNEMESEDTPDVPRLVVLIPYASLDLFSKVEQKLEADPEYLKKGAAYYGVEKANPAYTRLESNLLQAMKVPDTGKARIFEMREYEGHSEHANNQKMHMFNDAEAACFAASGLTSVFYSKTVIGKNRPSLFYMVTFDDMDDHAKDWDSFRENPWWAEIRTDKKYEGGGLSGRSTYMLKPTTFSQI